MANFSLSKKSVRFVIIGLIVMVSGYILMLGGGASDPNSFSWEMFDFRRLVLSPILVILGIFIVILSIMRKPQEPEENVDPKEKKK